MFGEPPQTVDNLIERAAAAKLCGGRAVVSRHSRLAAAVHVVHAFRNAFRLEGARRAGGMHRSMAIGRKSGGSTQIYETKPILHALQ
jgi:hypothetical protein